MARLPRLFAPGIAQYVLQRAAAGRLLFDDPDDYQLFTTLLGDAVRRHGIAPHAYVLLPGEFRLLGTPPSAASLGQVMQAIGRIYAPHRNRRSAVSGPLWDRRFRSSLIADGHVLTAMRHVERRPVMAATAPDASAWRWSSFPHHVGLRQQDFVSDHRRYWALSDTPFERQAIYRALVAAERGDDEQTDAQIDRSVERGWAWDDTNAASPLALHANRRTVPLPRGRKPVK